MESSDINFVTFKNNSSSEDGIPLKENSIIIREKLDEHISSSKIKLKNIVDYKWELKPYPGRLVAVHLTGNLIAYAIKVNSQGKTEGMIRIVNVETGKRILLKGMSNEALDLEFAFVKDPVLLAYIEETALHVQKIVEVGDKIEATLVFKLIDPIGHVPKCDKVSWCPYVPESKYENDIYASQLLVWSRDHVFQCYSISDVSTAYGPGPHKASDIVEGGLIFKELKSNILDIIYSPDGTTLATATEDGVVRFYQIYLHSLEDAPRRLHEWKPHDGKPVKKIFFLDNLNQYTSDDSLWKNAITYSEEQQEIKLWCCESWNCLQKISFKSIGEVPLNLLMTIDKTASYLVASDLTNRELYVFQVDKTATNVTEAKIDNAKTIIKSVAKFPLASPILSFSIVSAAVRRYRCALSDAYLINEMDDYDEETNSLYCVALRMFFVQPKSVQECNLLYQPLVSMNTDVQSTFSSGENDFQDEIPEILNGDSNKDEVFQKPEAETKFETQDHNLKPVSNVSDQVLSTLYMLANMQDMQQKTSDEENFESFTSKKEEPRKDMGSGDSSPSREVEKILSLNDVECYDSFYEDENDTALEDGAEDGPEECTNVIETKLDEERPVLEESKIKTVKPDDNEWCKAPMAALLPNLTEDGESLRQMSQKMSQLIALVENQSHQLTELKKTVQELKSTDKKKSESDVENTLKLSLSLHEKVQAENLEKVFQKREEKEQSLHDATIKSLNQNIQQYLDCLLVSLVSQVKAQILPDITTKLERVEQGISNTLKSHKQQSDEMLVKLYKNQSVSEALSRNIASSLKVVLQGVVKEQIELCLVPAYEKLSKEMFAQLNKVFIHGTQEYMKAFERHSQHYKLSDEQMQQVANVLRILPEQLNTMNDEILKSNSTTINQVLNKDLKTMQMHLAKVVKEQIKVEIQKRFEEQTSSLENSVLSVVRSQAQTPAPSVQNTQENICAFLQQSQINKAFHVALLANDLSLVEFTINKADFSLVFYPCALEQPVLLSLIQQLSADMKNHSDIKQRYLSEAIVNLNFNDSSTREHAPKILKELRQNCQAFLKENPSSHLYSSVRMLIMASQGVGNQS